MGPVQGKPSAFRNRFVVGRRNEQHHAAVLAERNGSPGIITFHQLLRILPRMEGMADEGQRHGENETPPTNHGADHRSD